MNGCLPNPSAEKTKTVLTERKIGEYPNSWQTSKICQLFFVVAARYEHNLRQKESTYYDHMRKMKPIKAAYPRTVLGVSGACRKYAAIFCEQTVADVYNASVVCYTL